MSKAIIFAAPSGSGKTSIVKELLKSNTKLQFSISATTRKIRHNETNGKDYHFLSLQEFKNKIHNEEFLEYQEVYQDLFYGTLKTELEKIWQSGGIVLFDVDVVGGVNLKKIFGEDAFSVFVKAPSFEELKQRLTNRSTETEETLNLRLSKAESEMKYQTDYDYVLVNDDFSKAVAEIKSKLENFINS
jgi:guanylate kinase